MSKTLIQWGSEYHVSKRELKCSICGKSTYLYEIFYQVPICSRACQKALDKEYIDYMEKEYKANKNFIHDF